MPESKRTMDLSPVYPFDPTVGKYHMLLPPYIQPWEYNGWRKETQSWKRTCYITAQLNPNTCVRVVGPDASKFLSDWTTNGYDNFKIGRCKHAVMTDSLGRVKAHGLALKVAENDFLTYSLSPWLDYELTKKDYDCRIEDLSMVDFNFQCGGPRVLEMLEKAANQDLHDIPFMGFKYIDFNGKRVFILRMGMAGTLAYEVHGQMEDAEELYKLVYEAGKEFGVERLGWLCYASNHTENGYPQEGFHFKTASVEDQGFLDFLSAAGFDPYEWPAGGVYVGSSGLDLQKRYRNPLELNWQNSINWNHEFPGREALLKIKENPQRKTVTLIWNLEDVFTVFKSLFETGEEPYKIFNFPMEDISLKCGGGTSLFQDDVFDKDGKLIGYSAGRSYTIHTRQMFSLATIDIDEAEIGNEVFVLWGEPDDRQIKLRAKVEVFPLLSKTMTMNYAYDVSTIPRLAKKI
jgi:glycine cleavage system aminomethyltransferase T